MGVQDGRYNEKKLASLSCHATGTPIPQISWYFNNTKLNENEKYLTSVSKQLNDVRHTLIIINVLSFDAGLYVCEAANIAGNVTNSGILTVLGKQ